MVITIGGTPGSGKGTVARKLSRWLHYRIVDIGRLRRQHARQRGLTLAEYNRLAERDDSTDRGVDRLQQRLGRTARDHIFDGRMSFHFVPRGLKIFLYAEPEVAGRRIWKDLRRSSQRNEGGRQRSVADVVDVIRERMASDRRRYRRYYGINPYLRRHYDFYLDTSHLTPTAVYQQVKRFIVDKSHEQMPKNGTRVARDAQKLRK